jgi:hypothetical protein
MYRCCIIAGRIDLEKHLGQGSFGTLATACTTAAAQTSVADYGGGPADWSGTDPVPPFVSCYVMNCHSNSEGLANAMTK